MEHKLSEEDWQNLRLQLKTLVDVYCEMNNDIVHIKTSLKAIVKHLRKQDKRWSETKPQSKTKCDNITKKSKPSKS